MAKKHHMDPLEHALMTGERPGFAGHDRMRDIAEETFRHELRHTDMHVPGSPTSPGKSRMRMYKKGGHVNHHSKHHGLNHDQMDLHLPHRKEIKSVRQPRMSKVEHKSIGGVLGNMFNATPAGMAMNMGRNMLGFKKGGKAHHKAKHGRHHAEHHADGGMIGQQSPGERMVTQSTKRIMFPSMFHGAPVLKAGFKHGGRTHHKGKKHHYATGGAINDMQNMNAPTPQTQSLKVNPALKRGGKVHHKHHAKRMAYGGLFGDIQNGLNKGLDTVHGYLGQGANLGQSYANKGLDYANQGLDRARSGINSGISSVRGFLGIKKGGRVHHKSEGGPMRGEHPSHHLVPNNYESDMKGEERVRKSYRGGGHCAADGGMMRFDKGGASRYAAGGVGKIRHGVADKHGHQKLSPYVKRGKH